jgi:hypothetical protein
MNYAPQHRLPTFIEPLSALSLWLKISVVLLVSVAIKAQPTQPTWAVAMPVFAALVLVPIGIQLVSIDKTVFNTHLTVAVLLAISFLFDQSKLAGCLALPYFVWCLVLVLRLILVLILRGPKFDWSLTSLMILAAFGFLTNAAAWLVFDRFGYQPMGFSPWIVLLTQVLL